MPSLSSLKEKLGDQMQKSNRIKEHHSGQMPSTRGGAGNIKEGAGPDGSDKYPGGKCATTEHESVDSDGHFGVVEHNQK